MHLKENVTYIYRFREKSGVQFGLSYLTFIKFTYQVLLLLVLKVSIIMDTFNIKVKNVYLIAWPHVAFNPIYEMIYVYINS